MAVAVAADWYKGGVYCVSAAAIARAYSWGKGNEIQLIGIDSLGIRIDSLGLVYSNDRNLHPASRFCPRWNRFVFEQKALNDFLNRFASHPNRLDSRFANLRFSKEQRVDSRERGTDSYFDRT
ncbi:hypothetical protein PIB30_049715 [Stylosanthes scabra]|uniref:Uncharacterized protein n=1 Tax=Stylosanthes scabra TaxID=79078 RepID=A0ABU6QHM0_9FABA|nr:hypothetical protein [Stylosanthes scabra]